MHPALGLSLILLSTLTTAAYFTLATKLMRSIAPMPSNFFLCITNYSAALILLPFWLVLQSHHQTSWPDAGGWQFFFYASCFLLLSRELYFYAYAHTDIANITVFSALTPIYTLVTGFVLLHEIPTPQMLAGMLMITLAIYSIFLPAGAPAEGFMARCTQPFKRILTSLPILCGFLSTIPTAFGAVYQKKTLFSMDIVSFSLCLFITIGSVALIVELSRRDWAGMKQNLQVLKRPVFWWAALFLMVMHVSFAPILIEHNSATALTLQRCSILFQIIFAYYFLGQRDDFRRRLAAGFVILLGFILIWNQ